MVTFLHIRTRAFCFYYSINEKWLETRKPASGVFATTKRYMYIFLIQIRSSGKIHSIRQDKPPRPLMSYNIHEIINYITRKNSFLFSPCIDEKKASHKDAIEKRSLNFFAFSPRRAPRLRWINIITTNLFFAPRQMKLSQLPRWLLRAIIITTQIWSNESHPTSWCVAVAAAASSSRNTTRGNIK